MGVPTVVQQVKNLTAAAWVTAEAGVQLPVQGSGLKALALLQVWRRSQMQLRFDPQPRNFHMPWGCLKKKKKRERERQTWGLAPSIAHWLL